MTSKQRLKSIFTPTIQIYGEVIVSLGGWEYVVNAPNGATIRENVEKGYESVG